MSEPISHETAQEFLPWYVNGTLPDSEQEVVDAHVRACLVCQLEMKKERRLQELVQSSPTVDLSPEAGFDRLSHRLDRSRSPERTLSRFLDERWRHWAAFGMSTRVVMATLALAAVAVLLWGALPHSGTPIAPDYITLTGDTGAGGRLDIIFADHVTEPERRGLLGEINASIVAGPTPIGRYTVRLDDAAIDDAGLSDLAAPQL